MSRKLEQLAYIEGCSVESLLDMASASETVPGICIIPDCDYHTYVEPDCDEGYCQNCEIQTVKSCLVLAGIL